MKDTELEIGVIGRPHGVRGDVLVWLHNPASDLLDDLDSLCIEGPDGTRRELGISRLKAGAKGAFILVSRDIGDRDAAGLLRGWKVVIEKDRLPPLEDADEFYYHELIGKPVVTASGRRIGQVRDVMETNVDILAIERDGGGELLVPMVGAYIERFDRAAGQVIAIEDLEDCFADVL